MTKAIKLNEDIYHLLVEKNFNHFTITALRNTLQALNDTYKNPDEARRFVYRQVMRLVDKDLLVRDENPSPKRTQYSKTPLFKTSIFTSVTNDSIASLSQSQVIDKSFNNELHDAIKTHELEMTVLVSELEEYKRLIEANPNCYDSIVVFLDKGQARLLSIKGKLAALNNIQQAVVK
ncbi:hypothetical protein [Pseudoalteromonas translucida]|uniref:Orphan protein n=1 Tax=Pseudoalteromonas translucida (strain TAC 125) TaxID=326442 RepID=Q3IHZ9_PSET1|nr:hypothetical protein [Pseudoalteromonas translucida]CAI87399.1 putative orphan protein [Pseudoalteromonas translucida]